MRGRPALRDATFAFVALIVVLAIPLLHRSPAFEDFVIRLSAMALFATSLNLLVGNTGMVSFGHGMFYGLGAYIFALTMQMTSLSLPLAAVLAVLATTLIALCVGAICVRLSTDYFAFITLAVQMLFYSIIISWQSFTGGDQGLRGGIPRREFFGFELASQLHLYQFCAVVAVLGLLALRHISGKPVRTDAAHDPRQRGPHQLLRRRAVAGAARGPSLSRAALPGSAACWPRCSSPAPIPNSRTGRIPGQAIFAVMLGGINSFLGPVLGAAILLALNDVVNRFTEYQGLVLGIVILIAILGLRRGVLDFLKFSFSRTRAMKLEIKNLTKAFGGVRAIDDVSLDFPSGSLSAVIGPNGAGKSTFFNLISGAFPADSGQVLLDGEDVGRLCRAERMHRGIGRAFQVASCFPTMTVAENLMAAVTAHVGQWGNLSHRFPPPGVRERADEVMELVGLTHVANVEAAILSHGDQKLLDIAIALALEPKVLLLDEPTAGMGPDERWRMIERVRGLWEQRKLTLVFIEHDMDIVFQVANTIRVLCYGRVLAEGAPDAYPQQPGCDRSLSRHGGASGMTDLLRAEGVSACYGASQILFDVDLALAEKRTLALLGRNGAGKSTTMKTLAGIVPAKSGRIFFAGRDITSAPPHARAKLGLAYVPEDRQVFPEHSVEDNLADRGQGWPRRTARLDPAAGLGNLSAAGQIARAPCRPAVRRRAAAIGDRARLDGQPAGAAAR